MNTTGMDRVTPEEYLRIENAAEFKSEYYEGEMFAMAGTSPVHSLINARIIGELHRLLRGKNCAPYDSNLRVHIPSADLYTYPDVSVICGPLEFSDRERITVTNPTLIVEVLSASTEAYDRGKKFELYRQLPSFAEYVLVSQYAPVVEVFFREPDGRWRLTPVRGREASVALRSLEIELSLAEIYDRVEFPAIEPLKPNGQ